MLAAVSSILGFLTALCVPSAGLLVLVFAADAQGLGALEVRLGASAGVARVAACACWVRGVGCTFRQSCEGVGQEALAA